MPKQPLSYDCAPSALIWALVVAILAQPASALSCMRPDPMRSFDQAASAREAYVVLYGRFAFDPGLLPKRTGSENFAPNDVTEVPARFVGNGLTPRGFTVPVVRDVTLRFECLGPWCGSGVPDVLTLAFVEKIGADYALTIGPCRAQMFDNPETKVLASMAVCMAQGVCPTQ